MTRPSGDRPSDVAALREAGMHDVQVIVGGIVPAKDEEMLLNSGVAQVFHPGTSLDDVVVAVRSLSETRRALQGKKS